jgi:hypothetical protein
MGLNRPTDNLGATDEEVKAFLREDVALAFKTCNQQRAHIAALERELAAKPKQYEFLNPDFLALMNDIGRLGHEKFGDDAIEVTGDTSRTNPRHQRGMNMLHAYRHITAYEDGVKHDHFGDLKHQLAAVSFNCMIEFWFSQHEQGE